MTLWWARRPAERFALEANLTATRVTARVFGYVGHRGWCLYFVKLDKKPMAPADDATVPHPQVDAEQRRRDLAFYKQSLARFQVRRRGAATFEEGLRWQRDVERTQRLIAEVEIEATLAELTEPRKETPS